MEEQMDGYDQPAPPDHGGDLAGGMMWMIETKF